MPVAEKDNNKYKSIKTEKKIWNPALFGIRNPLSWNPESSTRNPESTGWNPESRTVMDSLTWGEISVLEYYKVLCHISALDLTIRQSYRSDVSSILLPGRFIFRF